MTNKPVQTSAMASSFRHIPGDFLLTMLTGLLLLLNQFSIHVENAMLVGGSRDWYKLQLDSIFGHPMLEVEEPRWNNFE